MIIGINGNGFIGYHLWVYFTHKCTGIQAIRLNRDLMSDLENLSKCDVVIHTAEKNRGDEALLYDNNTRSTQDLITALSNAGTQPLLIYTSSIHENTDTVYGEYRRNNISNFKKWAKNDNFISIQLPNIFGPFCKPNYNSFIATFCSNLINGESSNASDTSVKLLYVDNLCRQIYNVINRTQLVITCDDEVKVADVYNVLSSFKAEYLDKYNIPEIKTSLEHNLFNTFRSYIPNELRLFSPIVHSDKRGYLYELAVFKQYGQVFSSITKPTFIRGGHFHTKRIERFCIIDGCAKIKIKKVGFDEKYEYIIKGEDNKIIDMPLYYMHTIENIGDTNLICCFWMNDILKDQKIDDSYIERLM